MIGISLAWGKSLGKDTTQKAAPPKAVKTAAKKKAPEKKVEKQKLSKKERIKNNNKTCTNNLRQLDAATQQWALESYKKADDKVYFKDIAPYLRNTSKAFYCPSNHKPYQDGHSVAESWLYPNYQTESEEFSGHKIP
jgi:hypothetical protein